MSSPAPLIHHEQPAALSAAPAGESEWRVVTLAYDRRGLARLFSWLLWDDLAWSIRDRAVGPVLQLILKQFQASDRLAGLLSGTFPAAVGLILGPIISFRSDHYRGRQAGGCRS